ncbi:MAG: molybdopterin converting factor subunit 1 [Verrucomicrobia bacterium]|nr:molybdopterin converting factor subunit 1 [Verrucomicrobiota bacterium]MDA1065909.1 molybdopterin converting factor subunit 1 [Verrucomicrobiota bacterium]
MTIQLYYFAILQDQRGLQEEKLEIETQTVAALYAKLKAKYGFTLEKGALRVSINQAFVTWETELQDGDEVVFIPPVSGG